MNKSVMLLSYIQGS